MSLEILKKLSSLDAEVRRLTQLHNEVLHGVRRRFLNQMMEWFSMLVEAEGFKIIRAPLGATARLDQTELVLNCTDPSITLQDSEAQYTITCSLSPERSYVIVLYRQSQQTPDMQTNDANDQITNKMLEIRHLEAQIANPGKDLWFAKGRLERASDVRGTIGRPPAPFETFQNLEQSMKTALAEISAAANAPRNA